MYVKSAMQDLNRACEKVLMKRGLNEGDVNGQCPNFWHRFRSGFRALLFCRGAGLEYAWC